MSDAGDRVKAAVELAGALDRAATEAIGVIGKDRLRRGLEFGLRYFYAPETLTPEQRKMAEDLLRDGLGRPQWEAGPWHPLDVPGGVKKP